MNDVKKVVKTEYTLDRSTIIEVIENKGKIEILLPDKINNDDDLCDLIDILNEYKFKLGDKLPF